MSSLDVFISYAREDWHHAKKLNDRLKFFGIITWIDQENMEGGLEWKTEIRNAIKNCTKFIAILSNTSVSKKGHVQKELKIAIDILEEFPPNEIYIIPVRIEKCEPEYEQLKERHWIDLFPESEFEKNLHKILKIFQMENLSRGPLIKIVMETLTNDIFKNDEFERIYKEFGWEIKNVISTLGIITMNKNERVEIRANALKRIAQIGLKDNENRKNCIEILFSYSQKENDFHIRIAGIESLGEFSDITEVWKFLLEFIEDDEETREIQRVAIESLGASKEPSVIDKLSPFLEGEDNIIRTETLKTINSIINYLKNINAASSQYQAMLKVKKLLEAEVKKESIWRENIELSIEIIGKVDGPLGIQILNNVLDSEIFSKEKLQQYRNKVSDLITTIELGD